jgi:hypothetical protein
VTVPFLQQSFVQESIIGYGCRVNGTKGPEEKRLEMPAVPEKWLKISKIIGVGSRFAIVGKRISILI